MRSNKRKRSQVTRPKQKRSIKVSLPWKKLLVLILFVLPLGLLLSAYQWIQDPSHLTIKQVVVTGDLQILDKKQLTPVIEPFTKTNLYLLDAKALEKAIEDNPWVYSASMTSIWPDKLVVKIFEQNPVAFWGEDEMLAENGVIIKASLKSKKDILPKLFSPSGKGRNMATGFLRIREWMKDFPLKMVEFREDSRGSWQIKLENGVTLKIGRELQEKRLRRFMVGYEQSLNKVIEKISAVDLRYTNGFAVQWKKGKG